MTIPFVHTSLWITSHPHEYAFGGHMHPQVTGVYATAPMSCPPGARLVKTVRRGHIIDLDEDQISNTINEVSEEFMGMDYDLLSRNCNHFTDYLCRKLTGKGIPGWLNRAAKMGVAMPWLVPREWIKAPTVENSQGAIYDGGSVRAKGAGGGVLLLSDGSRGRLARLNTGQALENGDGTDSEDDSVGDRRQMSAIDFVINGPMESPMHEEEKIIEECHDKKGRTLPPSEIVPESIVVQIDTLNRYSK